MNKQLGTNFASTDILGVILAAGRGSRMRSKLPKVLHRVGGKQMLERVCAAMLSSGCESICVVLGENIAAFADFLDDYKHVSVCLQRDINGTAGAVGALAPLLHGVVAPNYARTARLWRGSMITPKALLICAGDTPALTGAVLGEFLAGCRDKQSQLSVLGMELDNPSGYGRLLMDGAEIKQVVEERDANATTRRVRLCNSGVMFAKTQVLFELLPMISSQNAKREYYLTDCIAKAVDCGIPVDVEIARDASSLLGVNDQQQLLKVNSQLAK